MSAYIVRRLFSTLVVMAVVAFVVFSLLYLTPGDPAVIIAGDYATPDDIAMSGARLGLDQPFHAQVGLCVSRIVRGDLVTSIFPGLPASSAPAPV
jgi:peptide/nickel transport system permease protein